MSPRGPRTTPDPGAPLVELVGVSHAYDRTTALRGADLVVHPGEVVAVTGPSGSGKSTLLQVAAGLLRPTGGRAHLLGHDLTTATEDERARLRRRGVGLVLQFGQLVPDLPVLDDVALPLLLEGVPVEAARAAARDQLALVGLAEHAGATPEQLSGGQAQRAAVARALIAAPRVVLADEPVASLDARGAARVMALLEDVARRRGGALVVVTHDNTVAALADREVRMREGAVDYVADLR